MNLTADQKSDKAREITRACRSLLDYPAKAHEAHESAAAAHDNEAFGPERDRHLRLAKEHRAAAAHWAKRELEWKDHPWQWPKN